MSEDLKHACHECGGNIAYPQHAFGAIVHCPHCGMQTTLGEKYAETPEVPPLVRTKRIEAVPLPASFETASPTRSGKTALVVGLVVACVLIAAAVGTFNYIGKRNETERSRETDRRIAAEAETARLKAEAEEQAKATAKAIAQAKDEAIAKAVAQAKASVIADAAVAAAAEAKREEEKKAKAQADKLERLKGFPAVWALWEEQDRSAIKINSTKDAEAVLIHKAKSVTAKYDDMPDWLKTTAMTKHKDDGEAQGLIREVNGTTYDLRNNPPGWVTIPRGQIIQVISDGYLVVNEQILNDPSTPSAGTFKLLHNGFSRIFSEGTRMQVRGMSVGTYTYRRKAGDTIKVPVYDPGMPVGPLAKSVVRMEPQ